LRDSHLDPEMHDDDMIASAFEIIVPREDPQHVGQWDFAGEFVGEDLLEVATPLVAEAILDKQGRGADIVPAEAAPIIEEPVNDEVVDDILAFLEAFD